MKLLFNTRSTSWSRDCVIHCSNGTANQNVQVAVLSITVYIGKKAYKKSDYVKTINDIKILVH